MISKPEGVVDKVGLRVGDWQILAFAGPASRPEVKNKFITLLDRVGKLG